ncbi:Oligoribonuclease, mitochondrial [Heterocephalus glaber]|uniref:Oligoribonuclease, mitochondrial n=1 Tax=Heterocephalus glaber TaxID=10181 RepID=G5B252_HETGA|nr:Oligoribonuclease, mitochondrial [Heterocephalus glaber]
MAQRMVWVDLEMTGLDTEKDRMIETACPITDSDPNILAEGPNLIIKQPDELLGSMSDWCKEHRGKVTLPNNKIAALGIINKLVASVSESYSVVGWVLKKG